MAKVVRVAKVAKVAKVEGRLECQDRQVSLVPGGRGHEAEPGNQILSGTLPSRRPLREGLRLSGCSALITPNREKNPCTRTGKRIWIGGRFGPQRKIWGMKVISGSILQLGEKKNTSF